MPGCPQESAFDGGLGELDLVLVVPERRRFGDGCFTGGGRDLVMQRAQQGNVDVHMPDALVSFDPFDGL